MKSPACLFVRFAAACALFLLFSPVLALATPDYAKQTGFECSRCHVDATGGGALTRTGEQFLNDLKTKGLYRSLSTVQHVVRLLVGYLHLMAAIAWFGAIMYVHVLLKPAYASKGLPKGELRLGWISMIVILVTGVQLTIARMPSFAAFYTTRFGILLSVKIFLFLVMLISALIVTVFIGPRMRRKFKSPASALVSSDMTVEQLSHFDGKENSPSYIAYRGMVYNMTKSKLWKNGSHVMKHAAGRDLTALLAAAPHGEDKILAMPVVGKLLAAGEETRRPFHERLFYFFAYMNLVLVFVITFVIALWRWW